MSHTERSAELLGELREAVSQMLAAKRNSDLWELIQVQEARRNLDLTAAEQTLLAMEQVATGKNKDTRDAQLADYLTHNYSVKKSEMALLCVESRLLELREEEEAAEWAVTVVRTAIRMHLATMELVGRMEEA